MLVQFGTEREAEIFFVRRCFQYQTDSRSISIWEGLLSGLRRPNIDGAGLEDYSQAYLLCMEHGNSRFKDLNVEDNRTL